MDLYAPRGSRLERMRAERIARRLESRRFGTPAYQQRWKAVEQPVFIALLTLGGVGLVAMFLGG